MVSRLFWQEILKPKWFHEVRNKNKLKPLGASAGPEGRSGGRNGARSAERRPERRPEGPAEAPSGLNLFFFALHEYHFGFQDFLAKIVVNTTKKVKKINEIQVTK